MKRRGFISALGLGAVAAAVPLHGKTLREEFSDWDPIDLDEYDCQVVSDEGETAPTGRTLFSAEELGSAYAAGMAFYMKTSPLK